MNTKKKGDLSVAKYLVKFLQNGITVSVPWGDCDSYDLVIQLNGKLLKVQCKTAWLDQKMNVIHFSKRSITTQNGKIKSIPYTKENVDIFAVYYPKENKYFICDHSIGGVDTAYLRIEKPKNNQKKLITMADDVLFQKWINNR